MVGSTSRIYVPQGLLAIAHGAKLGTKTCSNMVCKEDEGNGCDMHMIRLFGVAGWTSLWPQHSEEQIFTPVNYMQVNLAIWIDVAISSSYKEHKFRATATCF